MSNKGRLPTKDGMVKLCRSLETRFGDCSVFKPDGIGGGFIHWASWHEKTEHAMDNAAATCRLATVPGAEGSSRWAASSSCGVSSPATGRRQGLYQRSVSSRASGARLPAPWQDAAQPCSCSNVFHYYVITSITVLHYYIKFFNTVTY